MSASPPPTDAARRGQEASELVAAAKQGDERAFARLVELYRPRIYALALHLTGRPSDADDITQDAFLQAFRRLDSFEGRSEFFTWLYRIALHRALNVKRNRGRRPTVGLEDARLSAAIAVDAPGDPDRALALQENYGHLLEAFDALSPLLRTTVVLTTLQGLSYKEAAVVLDTSEGTVAWRVHEARRMLRANITKAQQRRTPTHIQERAKKISGEHEVVRFDELLSALVPAYTPV